MGIEYVQNSQVFQTPITAIGSGSSVVLNIVAGSTIYPLTTINKVVSALAVTVNNQTLYLPLLSGV